jgi:O-antigen/teichoic acid export membrane protein
MEKGDFKEIKNKGKIYRDFFTIIYALLLLLSPELIKIMANEIYWESLVIIPYIFAGYYLSYMYTLEVKTEFFYKKTNLISIGTFLSAVINIALNILFIPKFGYISAAVTTTISYLFLFVFHYFITSKVIKESVYGLRFHIRSLVYLVAITIYFILFTEYFILRVFGVLITLVLGYMRFNKSI